MTEEFESAEDVRIRIESRDGRMMDDLNQNYSGRTWFDAAGVDILGEDAE